MKANFWHIWTIPIVLGGLSLVGLVAALVGDGLLDIISWISLAIPLAIVGWFTAKPRQRSYPAPKPHRRTTPKGAARS